MDTGLGQQDPALDNCWLSWIHHPYHGVLGDIGLDLQTSALDDMTAYNTTNDKSK